MKESNVASGLSPLDRPNSYIGRAVPRPNLKRLLDGRGQFVSDVVLPRMAHVAFVRSPHAHARIRAIDTAAAERAPGVVAVVTGAELATICTPWIGVLTHLKGLKSAPQHAIAIAKACWQGEAVAAVVAKTRALAEDAAELVGVEYEPLAPVADPQTALDPGTPVIHPELGDNLAFERRLDLFPRRSDQDLADLESLAAPDDPNLRPMLSELGTRRAREPPRYARRTSATTTPITTITTASHIKR